ncbi:hypothetical protein JK359_32130 [Streptomyces actinomycinicus]|uniref:Uncharacterized protein n=1 Tax=Streptomyces actinomycinicus TaxID=1695166 RepID=A0A937ER88_9ACTN|nr:hypothetical protein [Streptomyces actinomycinicus]MBL1086554.1 hypothetical protein [Streptomyces actinomycinicus]
MKATSLPSRAVRRIPDRPLRAAALLLLLAGTLSGMSHLLPAQAGVSDLVRDAGRDGSPVVHVRQTDLLEVRASWSTGFLGDKEVTHRFSELPLSPGGVRIFEDTVRREARAQGKTVTFAEDDPLSELGGISAFVPVLYWRFIPQEWLRWAVLACGLAVLAAIAFRDRPRANPGHWYVSTLLTGAGFLTYLWCEPRPLWSRTAEDPRALGGGRVTAYTLVTSAAVALTVWGLATARA